MPQTTQLRSARSRRLQRRLVRHYLPLVLISALAMIGVDWLLDPGGGKLERLLVASAYVGLLLIGATLLLGPLNLLRRRPNPLSSDLRRDVGIWAGLVSLGHMLLGMQWHYPWEPWQLFWDGSGAIPLRIDRFGQASYIGLAGILIITLLLAISNDRALRTLGGPRWKAFQRLNYALLGLVALHATLFILEDERDMRYLLLVAIIIAVIVAGQIAGVVQRQRTRASSTPRPTVPAAAEHGGGSEELS